MCKNKKQITNNKHQIKTIKKNNNYYILVGLKHRLASAQESPNVQGRMGVGGEGARESGETLRDSREETPLAKAGVWCCGATDARFHAPHEPHTRRPAHTAAPACAQPRLVHDSLQQYAADVVVLAAAPEEGPRGEPLLRLADQHSRLL